MIVEGYYNVRILAKPMLSISVKGVKMLCENAHFDALTGNWIIDSERLLTSQSSGQQKHQHIPYHTGSGEIVCSKCGEICGCR